jgi:superfamily I DNA/RNA helicase
VLALLSRFRNGGERAAAFSDPNTAALARHVSARYESALRACNAVDFDDLILLTLKLFAEHPDVLQACREKYRYVMVDEYQDTNAAQFKLVHYLTSAHRNLVRGGRRRPEHLRLARRGDGQSAGIGEAFPGVKVVKLEQNYRSTTTILPPPTLSSRITRAAGANNSGRKTGRAQNHPPHFCQRRGGGAPHGRGHRMRPLARGVPWRDQAVLFRTNQQARPLETALRQAGIRYHLVGGQSYFDRREIKDFLAYLKMLVNPHDDISLLRIANVPARGLSDVTMERLLQPARNASCSVFAAMKHTDVQASFVPRHAPGLQRFIEWVERRRGSCARARPFRCRFGRTVFWRKSVTRRNCGAARKTRRRPTTASTICAN